MTLTRYLLPKEVFVDLAVGGGGDAAGEHLRAGQYSKRLLLLRGVRDLAEETRHEDAARARRAYDLLAVLQAAAPEPAAEVLRYPTVGSWALRTLHVLSGQIPADPSAAPGGMASVAAAAAIRAGQPGMFEVPVVSGVVTLPSLGRASVPGETGFATVRSSAGEAEVVTASHRVAVPADPYADGPGWEGLRRIQAEHCDVHVEFVVDDLDPNRMPGAKRLDRRLTDDELQQWASTLQKAWRVLVERHPAVADEVRAMVPVLTPLVAPPNGTSSATSKLAFGNVGLSTPPDPHSFAVTLAHEAQHTKLSALIDLVPLTEPDDGSRYYAPWRDDPRPLGGLLQGAYAHMGIAAFWRVERQVEHPEDLALRAHTEFTHWRDGTDEAIRTLRASGRLTVEGGLFTAEMAESMVAMCAEPVPDEARRRARGAAERHLAGWRRRNGDLPAGQPDVVV